MKNTHDEQDAPERPEASTPAAAVAVAERTAGARGAEALAAAAEAALVDLETRLALGMGPLERVQAARIREASARLLECAARLAADELMVTGSTGQQRSHPLLKTEQELRREISDALQKLSFRVEQRAMHARLSALEQPADGASEQEGPA